MVALVAEGGGMRGVVTGGMVTALEHSGMLDAFDILCGTSAGAFACAYFGAGQAALGARIYTEDLCDRRFIALQRGAFGRPIMSVDYLIDEVIVAVKPLDTEALLNQPARLIVIATDVATGLPYLLDNFADGPALREALRASCRVPFVAGPPVSINAHRLIDGAISAPLPLLPAVEAGATHVVALTSRSLAAADRKQPDWTAKGISRPLQRSFGRPLAQAFLGRNAAYAACRSALRDGVVRVGGGACVPVLGIGPTTDHVMDPLCQEPRLLSLAARSGFEGVIGSIS